MSQDQLTYSRASTASLIGLATQFLLTVLIAILGFYAGSKGLIAGAFYLIPGIWIWVLLWVLYKQHRLERDESLEAARLADTDAQSAALFDEAGAQLAQAKRRLENIYKWAMPIVSGLTAAYLLGVGILLLYLNTSALNNGTLEAAPLNQGVNAALISLLLVLGGLGGFLVARYVSGMTRVNEWQALRGGASTLIGNVFLGYLPLLVATLLALPFVGNNIGFVYLPIILPIIMALLGVEIILALVFGFYRPRNPGEFVRPAFDSRLLGWLTRPESIGKIFSETLNYQFGFEVSKSWFMRLLGKALLPLAVVCIIVVIAMTSIVIVEPHQQAVITRSGAFVRIAEPGINFKAPWPLGKAEKHDVERLHSMRLGSRAHLSHDEKGMDGPIFWTNQHVGEGSTEELLITAPPPGLSGDGEQDSVLGEMIGADIDINYRITDLRAFTGIDRTEEGASDPVELLRSIAQNKVTSYFASHDTDFLLKSGRASAGDELHASIQAELDQYAVGLEVVFVSVSGVHPPQEVAEHYHEWINALQKKKTDEQKAMQEADMIYSQLAGSRDRVAKLLTLISDYNQANAQMLALAPEAAERKTLEAELNRQHAEIELLMVESGGEVGQRLAKARATRWTVSLEAQARALLREADIEAYSASPDYFMTSRYLDVFAEQIKDRPKTILGPAMDADKTEVILDLPQDSIPGLGS